MTTVGTAWSSNIQKVLLCLPALFSYATIVIYFSSNRTALSNHGYGNECVQI